VLEHDFRPFTNEDLKALDALYGRFNLSMDINPVREELTHRTWAVDEGGSD